MALEPTHAELIREAIESRLLDVHTCIPGVVDSYDKTTQTASIKLSAKRALEGSDGETVHEEIPIIPNVPIGWFASGGFSIQLPVSEGDGVWVMFSEAAWSVFRSSGEVGEPGDLSRFSLSYPIAIPICRPMTKTLTPIGANEAVFGVPSGQVLRVGGVAAQFVALSNKVDAQLSSLKTAIGTAATAEGVAAGLNGMSSLNSALSGWPQGTGATKLKAE